MVPTLLLLSEMEMEKEELDETCVLLRKSRTGNDINKSTTHEIDHGILSHENNGHADAVQSLVIENEESLTLGGALENGSEENKNNGDQKSDNVVFYDKIEGVEDNSTAISNKNEDNTSIFNKEIENADVDDLINEDDQLEETEYDVENVVQNQNTHDLYCPNCNSCITKKVILRKRKRNRIRISEEEVKRNKIEVAAVQESNTDQVDGVDERNNEPDVFRCLSCFSFFIPCGKFGEKSGKGNVRDEQVTNVKKNWFTSMFSSTKQETVIASENSKERDLSNETLHLGGNKEGKSNISVASPHEKQQVGSYILTDQSVVENKNTSTNFTTSELTGHQVYSSESSQHTITKSKYEEVYTGETLTVNTTSVSVAKGNDTVITIDERPAESTQTMEGIISSTELASPLISGTPIGEVRKEFGIEIIKSIVYGGLAESITSLSVVTSAAGGNADTLNILALGMANIIGGLFIICHNLWELRCDGAEQINSQVPGQRNRYKELLGRRENFLIHAVVSIVSYLIFGLVPPIVYGFSFRESDDKELKLIVVAASSLLCILILAIGRAYIQRPPKRYFKCVLNFVMLGFMVSGVSYAGGVLIERLLEKFHLFEPSSVSNLLLPEMTHTLSAWASN